MTKARFIRDMLKHLQKTAHEMKSSGNTHGNKVNKVIKDAEKKSYESGFFHTGEVSKNTVNPDGTPYIIQDSMNWRQIFMNYLNN